MAGKEPDIGPAVSAVADNVRDLREARNLNYTQLSEKLLKDVGWSINAVGIRRIELRERRVSPDDLLALAIALGVSPVRLLMPAADSPAALVSTTGVDEIEAKVLHDWLTGGRALPSQRLSMQAFDEYNEPAWERANNERLYVELKEAGVKGLGDD